MAAPSKHSGDTPGDYRELGYSGTEGAGVAGNGSLVISRVSRDHAGFYLCQASNGIGPGLSKLIRLTVHGKIFTQQQVTAGWICVSLRTWDSGHDQLLRNSSFRGRISQAPAQYHHSRSIQRGTPGEADVVNIASYIRLDSLI